MWSLVNYKGGLLSISQEIAQAFNVNGLREVCIRWVDKQPVALDLVEFRFKVRTSTDCHPFH